MWDALRRVRTALAYAHWGMTVPMRMAVRTIEDPFLKMGGSDRRRLLPTSEELATSMDRLRGPYDDYVQTVSTARMAITFELAAFLDSFVRKIGPMRIADLGSGFSTYVLATASGGKANLLAVDESPVWIRRTLDFLERRAVSPPSVMTWDALLRERPECQFDLVIHDLGEMRSRLGTLAIGTELLAPGGYLIIDDVQRMPYRWRARRQLHRGGYRVQTLWRQTHNRWDRHAWLAQLRTESTDSPRN